MGYDEDIARQSAFQFRKTGDPRISMLRRFAKRKRGQESLRIANGGKRLPTPFSPSTTSRIKRIVPPGRSTAVRGYPAVINSISFRQSDRGKASGSNAPTRAAMSGGSSRPARRY
jgi:hypothetical protein